MKELLQQAVEALKELRFVLDCALGMNCVRPSDADGPAVKADEAIAALSAALQQPDPATRPSMSMFASAADYNAAMDKWLTPPALQQQEVPSGWKLVPMEPTEAMVTAYLIANDAYWRRTDDLPQRIGKWRTGSPTEATMEGYRAMLAASPSTTEKPVRSEMLRQCAASGQMDSAQIHAHEVAGEMGADGVTAPCLTCAANHYCPTHNPAPGVALAPAMLVRPCNWPKCDPSCGNAACNAPGVQGLPVPRYSGWLWTHVVKGGDYRMLGEAKLQTDKPLTDMAEVVVYQGADGKLWARERHEYEARFSRTRPDTAGVPASVAPVAVAWEYRTWRDGKGGEPVGWGAWERLKPKGLQTMDDAVSEMRDYIMRGYRYELRWLAAHPDGVQEGDPTVTVQTLRQHWLRAMECDHDTGRDKPHCACSRVDLGWHPSIGAAVEAWLTHASGVTVDHQQVTPEHPPMPGGMK